MTPVYKQPDKQKHFISGMMLSIVFGAVFSPLIGLGVGILGGIPKEVWDSLGHGHVEINDFLATAFGGLVGALIILSVN